MHHQISSGIPSRAKRITSYNRLCPTFSESHLIMVVTAVTTLEQFNEIVRFLPVFSSQRGCEPTYYLTLSRLREMSLLLLTFGQHGVPSATWVTISPTQGARVGFTLPRGAGSGFIHSTQSVQSRDSTHPISYHTDNLCGVGTFRGSRRNFWSYPIPWKVSSSTRSTLKKHWKSRKNVKLHPYPLLSPLGMARKLLSFVVP